MIASRFCWLSATHPSRWSELRAYREMCILQVRPRDLAIVCVLLTDVVKNAGILLNLVEKQQIPFFMGAAGPLIGDWRPPEWTGHGTDGLGDKCFLSLLVVAVPFDGQKYPSFGVTACEWKCFYSSDSTPKGTSGCIPYRTWRTSTALDLDLNFQPLTNIAIAATLDPQIGNILKPGRFMVMGGAHLSMGNSSYAAEFNMYVFRILHGWRKVWAIRRPLGFALNDFHKSQWFPGKWLKMLLFLGHGLNFHIIVSHEHSIQVGSGCESTRWTCEQVPFHRDGEIRGSHAFMHNTWLQKMARPSGSNLVICDAIAMVALLSPTSVIMRKSLVGTIELQGTHTRGATVFDWNMTRSPTLAKNVDLILEMDLPGIQCPWYSILTQGILDYCERVLIPN